MALRRSARLSAIPSAMTASLQGNSEPRRLSTGKPNGITKPPRRSSKKGSKTRKSTVKKPLREGNPIWITGTASSTSTLIVNAARRRSFEGDIDDSNGPPTSGTGRPHTPPLPSLDRPIEPHKTNATLLTPGGSSLVVYPPDAEQTSPSKIGLPHPTATAGNLLEKAVAHLIAADPRLKHVIDRHPCPLFSPAGLAEEVDPFRSLASSIIAQQVSGAAAKSIKDKFIALFNNKDVEPGDLWSQAAACFPTPAEVARCDIPTLRTAGLSQRKAEYIQGLAQKFASGELSTEMLLRASDEELVEKLTAVRGLGRWSVEMFACFALKRIDVFSTGDLGVQRGCAAFMGKDVNKLKAKGGSKFKYMSEKDMLELAAKFAPYRSLFMWYMWRVEDVDIAVLN